MMICAKSGQNLSCGSKEEVENVKVYRRTDRQTPDNRRSEKLTSSGKETMGKLKLSIS
jgi:hypothetical protein